MSAHLFSLLSCPPLHRTISGPVCLSLKGPGLAFDGVKIISSFSGCAKQLFPVILQVVARARLWIELVDVISKWRGELFQKRLSFQGGRKAPWKKGLSEGLLEKDLVISPH